MGMKFNPLTGQMNVLPTSADLSVAGAALSVQLPAATVGTTGVNNYLYADNVLWANADISWYSGGVAVPGAKGVQYKMLSTDAGKPVTWKATGTTIRTRTPKTISAYLPTISTARSFVLSTYLLLSGYAGPLFRLVRTSDNATMDVYPAFGGQAPDVASIAVWAGDSPTTVDIVYDQTGNGWHHSAASAAQRPFFNRFYPTPAGYYPIYWSGASNNVTYGLSNASWTGQRANIAINTVAATEGLGVPNKYWRLGVTGNYHEFINGTQASDFLLKIDSMASNTTGLLRTNVQSMGARFGATYNYIQLDTSGKTVGGGSNTTSTLTKSWLGTDDSGYKTDMTFLAHIVYGADPSDTDFSADQNFLINVFGIMPRSSGTSNVIFDGDSLTFGNSGTGAGCTFGQNLPHQIEPLLPYGYNFMSIGVPGQLMSTIYTNRTEVTNRYDGTKSKNILHVLAGTNDINAQANPSDTSYANTLWASYLLPYVQAAQAVGYKVIVGTLTARTSWSSDSNAQKNGIATAYNALIKNNASTYGYVVADYAALTVYLADGVHMVNQGYATMAPVCVAAITAAAAL